MEYPRMNELKQTVEEINALIQTQLWFDFEVMTLGYDLKVAGGLDLFYNAPDDYDLLITFSNVFYISSLMSWRTDTSKNCIRVLEGEEFSAMNKKHQITQGNYVFAISAEDYEDGLYYIVAENISYEITNTSIFVARDGEKVTKEGTDDGCKIS